MGSKQREYIVKERRSHGEVIRPSSIQVSAGSIQVTMSSCNSDEGGVFV